MARTVWIEVDMPEDLSRFTLPVALNDRLQALLDKQDREGKLTEQERREAESLVNLAELLTLLKLKAQQAAQAAHGDEP